MPGQILFIQGAGADAHDRWDNRLVDSLRHELDDGWSIDYPRMPGEAEPKYATWKGALLEAFGGLHNGAILIGHSVGGTVLLHVLADQPPAFRPAALILIAPPFIGEGGWPSDDIVARSNFALPAGVPVRLYHGSDDKTVPSAHMDLYAKAIPHAFVRSFPHRDHQLNDDLSEIARDILDLPPN